MIPILAQVTAPETPPWLWVVFAVLIVVVMALDLGVFHRTAHRVSTKEAGAWVTVWVSLALIFNIILVPWKGGTQAVDFFTAYVLELSMSVDNIFVFVVIFSYFGVRPEHQHRVLFWGILGAVVMRLLFIFLGIELVRRFDWVLYIFGAFLLYTGWKLLRHEPEVHPDKNIVLRIARRCLPVTDQYHGDRFFTRVDAPLRAGVPGNGPGSASAIEPPPGAGHPTDPAPAGALLPRTRVVATPLFLVLLVVEATDVVFAVDSVPAVLGITDDRFIAYTSNIFAILGLRSMFFLLAGSLDKFHYLRYGLSLVLIFIGVKMLLHHPLEELHLEKWITTIASLAVILTLLGSSIVASLLYPPRKLAFEPEEGPGGDDDDS
jgi:tellurite resistance protein TerC